MEKIQCPYYQLNLDDYSCPSFCSFSKPFHGRLSDIQGLIGALTLDNPKGTHDELISAFAEFQKGSLEVSHMVAYTIQKAHEICIQNLGKIQIKYINGILKVT